MLELLEQYINNILDQLNIEYEEVFKKYKRAKKDTVKAKLYLDLLKLTAKTETYVEIKTILESKTIKENTNDNE